MNQEIYDGYDLKETQRSHKPKDQVTKFTTIMYKDIKIEVIKDFEPTETEVDPLALMSNVSPQLYHSQSSTNPPTTYHQPHFADTSQSDFDFPFSNYQTNIENLTNTLALLITQSSQNLPSSRQTINQTSSNPRNKLLYKNGRVFVHNVSLGSTEQGRVIMHGVQVQLVMGEHRTEWGMLIRVKLGSLMNATTATG
ncbi:hypothetical protein Tco_1494210 [Tanacetum coccineum]